MAITIGDAILFLKAQGGQLDRDLDEAGAKADSWATKVGGSVNNLLKVGIAGAIAGAAGLVTGVLASVKTAGAWANTLDSLGDVLGTDARQSAALAVAIENVGGNVEAVTGQFTFLARGLETAKGELGPTGLELQKLGINVRDANGNLKDMPTIAEELANVFSKMPDGIEKSALMTRVMGRSGKDLSDVMNEIANGGLARADEKARQLGLTMSDETVAGFIAVGKNVTTIQQMLRGFMVMIGTAVLPLITRLLGSFMSFLANPAIQKGAENLGIALGFIGDGHLWSAILRLGTVFGFTEDQMLPLADAFKSFQAFIFSQFLPALQQLAAFVMDTIVPNLSSLLPVVGTLLVAAFAAWAVSAAAAAVATLLALAPLLLVGAGIAVLALAWTQNWGGIQEKTAGALAAITAIIQAALAAIQGWWAAHGETVMAGIAAWWATFQGIWSAAFAVLSALVSGALEFLRGAWETNGATIMGIVQNLFNILGATVLAFSALFRGDWDALGVQLQAIWSNIWAAIVSTLQLQISGVLGALGGLAAKFGGLAKEWIAAGASLGKSLMDGILAGILAQVNALLAKIRELMDLIRKAAGQAVGEGSPATKFIPLGKDIMAGIAKGLGDGLAIPALTMQGLTPALSGSAAGAASAPVPAAASPSLVIEQVHIHNDLDIADLAYRVFQFAQGQAA